MTREDEILMNFPQSIGMHYIDEKHRVLVVDYEDSPITMQSLLDCDKLVNDLGFKLLGVKQNNENNTLRLTTLNK